MAPKAPANPKARALFHTFQPPGSTALQAVLLADGAAAREAESPTDECAAARRFVLHLLDGPCATPLRPGHAAALVKGKGRVNANGHGAWVFSYDQRMPTNRWDKYTVLCRGLLAVFPRAALVAEGFREDGLEPGARLDEDNGALLRRLCTSAARHPCRIFEPMPKFWEAGDQCELTWKDVLAACSGPPRLLRLEEKVDGNLGMLYPQMDEELRPLWDAEPLLATKGTPHSTDIERQLRLLRGLHPALRLRPGAAHAIVEVVDVSMKVVVPYTEDMEGARLLAVSTGDAWLPPAELDALAVAWGLSRPAVRPLPDPRALHAVEAMAQEYALTPGEMLDEGFVVHLDCLPDTELVRLKVHSHVWNTAHGWWEDNPRSKSRITVASVLPVLRDPRFAPAGAEAFEPSLVKYSRTSEGRGVADERLVVRFREALARAGSCLEECLASVAAVLESTSGLAKGKALHPAVQEAVAAAAPGATSACQTALLSFIMCVRSLPLAGLHAALPSAQVQALPRAVRRAYGPAAASPGPGIGSEAEEVLARALGCGPLPGNFGKLVEVWAEAAQKRWEAELRGEAEPEDEAAPGARGRRGARNQPRG